MAPRSKSAKQPPKAKKATSTKKKTPKVPDDLPKIDIGRPRFHVDDDELIDRSDRSDTSSNIPAPPPGMFTKGVCILCNGKESVCGQCGEADCDCDDNEENRMPCSGCQKREGDETDNPAPNHLSPSLRLLSKLGAIIVHFDEYESDDGREVDLFEARQRLADPEVQQWLKAMGALLPLKRVGR